MAVCTTEAPAALGTGGQTLAGAKGGGFQYEVAAFATFNVAWLPRVR
jgi:hypothetical protein